MVRAILKEFFFNFLFWMWSTFVLSVCFCAGQIWLLFIFFTLLWNNSIIYHHEGTYILMGCNLVHKGWHHVKATGDVGTKLQPGTSKKVVFNCLSETCTYTIYTKHSKSVITERQQVVLEPILANASANLDDCRNRYKMNTKYSKSVITEEESRIYRQHSWQTPISMIAGCNKKVFDSSHKILITITITITETITSD